MTHSTIDANLESIYQVSHRYNSHILYNHLKSLVCAILRQAQLTGTRTVITRIRQGPIVIDKVETTVSARSLLRGGPNDRAQVPIKHSRLASVGFAHGARGSSMQQGTSEDPSNRYRLLFQTLSSFRADRPSAATASSPVISGAVRGC
jgi:hypothetical protein